MHYKAPQVFPTFDGWLLVDAEKLTKIGFKVHFIFAFCWWIELNEDVLGHYYWALFCRPPESPLGGWFPKSGIFRFLSVPFPVKPVQIAPGLRQLFENLSGLWEQAFWRSKMCPDCRILPSESASYPAIVLGYKKNKLHPRYLFYLQNIRFKLQIPSLIQSFILKNTTLIFLNPSTMAGTLQV